MLCSPRTVRGRLIGTLCLSAFVLQLSVLPLLHARHAAGPEVGPSWATSGSSEHSVWASTATDAHDGRSCPVCAVLAKSRVGIVPIGTTWQVPPLTVVQLSVAPSLHIDAGRSHTAEPRAPPVFSL